MNHLLVAILVSTVVLCNGAVLQTSELSKLISEDGSKHSESAKDLETSASDRSFLLGKDYGYGSGYGSGYGYGNYPGVYGYNRGGYYPNSVYRGYQTGLTGLLGGGGSGAGYGGYYGGGYGGVNPNYYGGIYGNGIGGYGYGSDDGLIGNRGYNRWNNLDGYGGYSGYGGYGGYGGAGYPNYLNRGYGSYSGLGYPTGYRGYS
ncbi:keratin-associated protein 19-2-like [Chelonus insularis]|uniref:keratin-associated protein 19-2-like n=1 Tax=Chelonus insularis TaxID=460826 RepID=UPI00158D9A08|nr:keratin-associated protein 19-2-like [Chelonus insularis]